MSTAASIAEEIGRPSRLPIEIAIAFEVHAGQVDKGGADYVLHPLHVLTRAAECAREVTNPYEREALLCSAVLHDAVEDSETPQQILSRIYHECGNRTYQAVEALTHRPGEPYEEYIERIGRDWIARRVKDLDLEHNSDARRLPRGHAAPPAKYAAARARLAELELEHAHA